MTRLSLFLVACQIFTLPLVARTDDDNPFMDMAASLLQNMGNDGGDSMNGLGAIGNIIGSMMQEDNAKNLGALFGQNGEGNAGDVIAGLSSLLTGPDGKINPSMISTMASMFAQQMTTTETPKRQKREEGDLNLESIMSLASGFLGNMGDGRSAGVLPVIMSALESFSETETKKRADDHKDHASFLPPFLEKAHLYWDIFINSDLGKVIWEKSGLKRVLKTFTGPDGKINFGTMLKNLENHSFRRHWIKSAATYITNMVIHIAKPEVYKRYMVTAQYVINGVLDTQGMPKSTHFNVKKPEKSLTALINHILQKNMVTDVDAEEYVVAAVRYIKQILKMAETATQNMASRGDYNAIADRITDTLNLEVIEPVLRVYRAYQHSVKAPHCQEHLMCLVNRHHDQDKKGLPGFKAGLTKLSSLAASAALSFQNGGGFFDLYKAIQEDVNCEMPLLELDQIQMKPQEKHQLSIKKELSKSVHAVESYEAAYPADCSAFHEHEMKVTTEVYHSEL